jgi:hypothetical protein
MTNIFPQPCDDGVIRAPRTVVPCARVSEPWILAATILGSSMVFIVYDSSGGRQLLADVFPRHGRARNWDGSECGAAHHDGDERGAGKACRRRLGREQSRVTHRRASGNRAFGDRGGALVQRELDRRLAALPLSAEVRREFDAQRVKLVGAELPSRADQRSRLALKQAVDESFVFSFRLVMLVALCLALAGAFRAFIMIENH